VHACRSPCMNRHLIHVVVYGTYIGPKILFVCIMAGFPGLAGSTGATGATGVYRKCLFQCICQVTPATKLNQLTNLLWSHSHLLCNRESVD